MTNINQWVNTFYVLSQILAQTIIAEWNNENSPFKESTPIPKWLDVFLVGDDVYDLVEKIPHGISGMSYHYEKLDLWLKIITNSSYDGYMTTAEFMESKNMPVERKRSIASTVANQAKNQKIKIRYKENTRYYNGGLVTAYPVEFLEKLFKEKGYLSPLAVKPPTLGGEYQATE